ncbi:hypothetical protein ACFZBP_21135 [Streptomyces sp. NPDC008086]|uniref:hypothetical protein n=1 Tax=Streptomyces sp. NPDC008086 TaxID=3364807 RepID=UPI0036EA2049
MNGHRSASGNGHLKRSETAVDQFTNGFSDTVIAAQDSNRYALFQAGNVYRMQGSD